MSIFESFAASMITNNIEYMQEQNKKVSDLESQLVVAHNHIRDLKNKNKLLVDKLAQKALTQPCQRNVDALNDRIEELENQLLLEQQERKKLLDGVGKQRNESDLEAARYCKKYDDLVLEHMALKQKYQTTVEELEELQSESDFYDIANGSMDKQLTALKIKLGLAYNQSVDLLVATNLIVANLLSEADIDWSVVAAMMQTVGFLNKTLEELSHV